MAVIIELSATLKWGDGGSTMHGKGLFESLVLKNTKRQPVLNECPTMTLTDIYVILVTHQTRKNHVS